MVKITRKAIAGGTGLLLMAGFAFPGAGVCDAATITYDVNQTIDIGTRHGTIQTDGATGVLGSSDFTGWQNLIVNGQALPIILRIPTRRPVQRQRRHRYACEPVF